MRVPQQLRRLNVQLIAFLLLALLPLGSVAVYQTNRVAVEADENAGLALLALTERAARGEQVLIERAVGAARLLGLIAPELLDQPDICRRVLSQFVNANPDYSFVGVLPGSGIADCSSSEYVTDFPGYPDFDVNMAAKSAAITVNRNTPTPGDSVFVVSEPFEVEGNFGGFVAVSIPHDTLPETRTSLQTQGLIELVTFNEDGSLLTAREGFAAAAEELPQNIALQTLPTTQARAFRAENSNGIERRYSVVPIDGTSATILAIWSIESAMPRGASNEIAPWIFPILMLCASLGVAMLAMHTLVLRHLSRMGRDMDSFAESRRVEETSDDLILMPLEIEKLSDNFAQMSDEILKDEATLENSLREKEVLVKEIHHRVKNNLQLISSIMNIQIRTAEHKETRHVLRRLQDRVLSLATIHRDLYQSQNGGRVNAGVLVSEIVDKSVEMAVAEGADVAVTTEIQPLRLFPDQTVPLSLLVAEAATNALKHIGDGSEEEASIDVKLTQDGSQCQLIFTNSIGAAPKTESTGLGDTLMNAFALQVGGQMKVEQTEKYYTLKLEFEALEFEPEARDY